MLIRSGCIASIGVSIAAVGVSRADVPQMGGGMSHLLVSIFNQQVFVNFESPAMSTVELLEGTGSFDGPASILNHTGHNAQFGWLANGFISLPPSSGVFVRLLGGSPHLSVYSEFGFDPILGTDGSSSIWQWDGTMVHNWYASDVKGGGHAVRYEVFVGDLSGNPLDGWTPGGVELNFAYGPDMSDRLGLLGGLGSAGIESVPSPGSMALLAGGLLIGRRRRGR